MDEVEDVAAAALVHANIVQIYEVGCVDGIHFIAQEYVQGQTVKQLVSRCGPLDPTGNERNAGGVGYYRVLSRGAGRQAKTVAVTEAIVARPWHGAHEPAAYPPERPLRTFCAQFDSAPPCGVLSWRELR